jgi:hypothetical protein
MNTSSLKTFAQKARNKLRDQVAALQRSGLVARLDLLRAEAALQQSRFRLEQADAQRQSRRQGLTNLLNVAFGTVLQAHTDVALQPPWPLPLADTLVAGLRRNPAIEQLAAERQALLRQADRRNAQLLPNLQLFAAGGATSELLTKPVIDLRGCCASSQIPQLASQSADWVAGLRLHWRLFDAGVTSGEVQASRAAAEAVLQRLARQRNQIRQELETAFYDYRASLSQLHAAEASYRASREAFRDARARYQPSAKFRTFLFQIARNRVIDALGLGDTYPLTDLRVADGIAARGLHLESRTSGNDVRLPRAGVRVAAAVLVERVERDRHGVLEAETELLLLSDRQASFKQRDT